MTRETGQAGLPTPDPTTTQTTHRQGSTPTASVADRTPNRNPVISAVLLVSLAGSVDRNGFLHERARNVAWAALAALGEHPAVVVRLDIGRAHGWAGYTVGDIAGWVRPASAVQVQGRDVRGVAAFAAELVACWAAGAVAA